MLRKISQAVEGLLPLFFVFIASIYRPFDPDLGWHLKYGEYFFQHHSILRENTFVTDMPSYHWVNTSWGIDLLYYLFYHVGGFMGLTLASALVVALTCYFFAKAFRLDYFEKALIFPIIVYFEYFVVAVSFRGQLVSILFLSILTYLMLSFERTQHNKFLYGIPILFLLWSNIHGQFFIGLGIYGLWGAFFLLKSFLLHERKLSPVISDLKKVVGIGIAAVIATLINPFGYGVYLETARYIHNPLLQDISEYVAPAQLSRVWWNQIVVSVLVIMGATIIFFRDKLRSVFTVSGILGSLFLLTFFILRYAWMMYYFIMPFVQPIAAFLKPDSKKAAFWAGTALFIISIAVTVMLKMPWTQYPTMSWDVYCSEYQHCSPQGAKVLMSLKNPGRLMNLYGWGGWLIWNYPGIRTSIDGRMHLWRDEKGYSAFEDYFNYEQNLKDVDKSTYKTVFMSNDKPVYNRLNQLVKQGRWKKIFEDKYSGIFVRI